MKKLNEVLLKLFLLSLMVGQVDCGEAMKSVFSNQNAEEEEKEGEVIDLEAYPHSKEILNIERALKDQREGEMEALKGNIDALKTTPPGVSPEEWEMHLQDLQKTWDAVSERNKIMSDEVLDYEKKVEEWRGRSNNVNIYIESKERKIKFAELRNLLSNSEFLRLMSQEEDLKTIRRDLLTKKNMDEKAELQHEDKIQQKAKITSKIDKLPQI